MFAITCAIKRPIDLRTVYTPQGGYSTKLYTMKAPKIIWHFNVQSALSIWRFSIGSCSLCFRR